MSMGGAQHDVGCCRTQRASYLLTQLLGQGSRKAQCIQREKAEALALPFPEQKLRIERMEYGMDGLRPEIADKLHREVRCNICLGKGGPAGG